MEYITSFLNTQNIDLFNPSSYLQLQQFLFAPYKIVEQQANIEKIKQARSSLDDEYTQEQYDLLTSQS
jgi:hypothetical protein